MDSFWMRDDQKKNAPLSHEYDDFDYEIVFNFSFSLIVE